MAPDATLAQILTACRALLCDTDFPTLQRWHELGGKVLGHFQVYFPEEIAHAAGLLPVKLGCTGDAEGQLDSHFGSYLCSCVKQPLHLALNHGLDLDMFVAPSICDAARNLTAVWSRNFSYPCRTLYLPQNSASPHAVDYLRREYDELAGAMAALGGRAPQGDDLRHSLTVFNRNRALLRQLYRVKQQQPWNVPVDACYLLSAVGSLLPREEHNRLLEASLRLLEHSSPAQTSAREKIRVLVSGCFCEQPPLEMLEAIGRSCHVVDDDLLLGLRWIDGDIAPHGDPLAALAAAYGRQSPYCPVRHDGRTTGAESLLRRVHACAARAVILAAPKMCEPGLEELVPAAAALDRAAIPYCVCEFEQSMHSFDLLELQLETFAENILYAAPSRPQGA